MTRPLSVALLTLTFMFIGCATSSEDALDPNAFAAHFSDLRRCDAALAELLQPLATALADARSIKEMRSSLRQISNEDPFAQLIGRVQDQTKGLGEVQVGRQSEREVVEAALGEELDEMLSSMDATSFGCGPAATELVAGRLYSSIGGDGSFASEELAARGIGASSERRWALLVALAAAKYSFPGGENGK